MDAPAEMLRLAEPMTIPPWKGVEREGSALRVRHIQMLRRAEVARRVEFGKTESYRRIRTEGFPAPVPLAPGRRAWVEHEIDAWIEKRIKQSRDDPSSDPNDPDQGDDLSR